MPDERTFKIDDHSGIDAPVMRVPELSLSTLMFAAVAIGIAQGALDDITAIATAKVPAFRKGLVGHEPVVPQPPRRRRCGAACGACARVQRRTAAWQTAVDRVDFELEQRARFRAATTWAVGAAASVVDVAYTDGGGSSIHEDNPLQRRLRDIHALTQHFAIKPDTFTLAGALLAGQDVDTSFL